MLDKKPNILEKTILKNHLAKKIYRDFLLEKVKKHPKAERSGELNKILAINTATGKGGAAKVAHDFLVKNIESAKILVNTAYGGVDKDIIELPQPNPEQHKALHKASRSLGWLDFFNLSSFEIPNLSEFKEADIVHLHNLHGAYFSLFLLPELTALKPTIWTLHDEQAYTGHCSYSFDCKKWQTGCGNCPDLNFYPKLKKDTTAFLWETKKKIYDVSDFAVVCPSKWLAVRAKQSILKDKDVRVIYNGIDPDVFTPIDKKEAKQQLGLPLDKKILMFSASGSFKNPQKGGQYLIEVYNRLKDNDDYLFVCLGSDKPQKKKNWLDIPYIKDEKQMTSYYSAADLFIYPSQAESFGLVITEAMACCTPVVAFNNTAIPELIDHMRTGYLAENRNVDDFINGIESMPDCAGYRARQVVLEKFTLDRMIREYIKFYYECTVLT